MASTAAHPPYPDPFIVEARTKHRRSLILLHGRGSNGNKFGTEFLDSQTSHAGSSIGLRLPDIRFIFPTARKRRAKWYNRATISQWFDSVPVDEQDAGVSKAQEGWQLEGLRQSRSFLKGIVEREIDCVGAANVFIGGLSQGCAMALHLLLSMEDISSSPQSTSPPAPVGGFIGMSGWLPFADSVESIMRREPLHDEDGDDHDEDAVLFASVSDDQSERSGVQDDDDDDDDDSSALPKRVRNFVRDNMDMPPVPSRVPGWINVPVLFEHGNQDGKVLLSKGQRASRILGELGMEVTFKDYDEGHWYKVPEQIDDIVAFLADIEQQWKEP